MLCKLGHQDTCLAKETLNPKTTQVRKGRRGKAQKAQARRDSR